MNNDEKQLTIDSQKFFDLCHAYRHEPVDTDKVSQRYEDLVKYIDKQLEIAARKS